ncbi:MAG TPA: hypothetical protein VGV92_06695 [Gammaproteobacteria bacterium]|nr:hypothetical protein [Gammaproteobacteria bacterium]
MHDYIYQEITLNKISPDIYFAFLELYWPSFVQHEGHIFLKETFSAEKFEGLKSQNENIGYWMNLVTIDPYFENDEDQEEKAAHLSKKLVDLWQAKLDKEYPELKFTVATLEDKEMGDYGLTFYQEKYAKK